MARFTYQCPVHGEFRVYLDRRERIVSCPRCDKDSTPILGAGSISIMERLDNGAMGRAVERLHNVEEILNERADKDAPPDEPDEG